MTLHAGTDAGSVVCFDPESLPDDYDVVSKDDPISLIERLHQAGKLFWFDAHADGDYRLGVFEGSGLPENLAGFVSAKEDVPSFYTPSGTLYFTGIEYVFRHNSGPLLKYPHMGESLRVTAGVHAATVYTLDYPDDFEDTLVAKQLPPEQLAARTRMNSAVPAGCLALAALILTFFLLPFGPWIKFVMPACLAAIIISAWLMQSKAAKSAVLAARKIMDDYPDYALVIHSAPTVASPL